MTVSLSEISEYTPNSVVGLKDEYQELLEDLSSLKKGRYYIPDEKTSTSNSKGRQK